MIVWKLILSTKNIIGKELSKFSMPVWVNEPISDCQKDAEFIFYTAHYLSLSSGINDSSLRMAYVAVSQASMFQQIVGRTSKPFNPLLGETYELVSPLFRYFNEVVSHHPPVLAFQCQAQNFQYYKQIELSIKFNGKVVNIIDKKPSFIFLKIKQDDQEQIEQYEITQVPLVVGNLVIGERYVEPQGKSQIFNKTNGDFCEILFRPRDTWKTKEEDKNFISGAIKDKNGIEKFKIWGKYSDKIYLQNSLTGQKQILYQSPKLIEPIQDKQKIYFMNIVTLQMNHLSDKLKQKLPPSDSRFRPDIRAMEIGNIEEAQKQKERLEANQRKRRLQIKKIFEEKQKSSNDYDDFKIDDERTFYTPLYFNKKKIYDEKGKLDYEYAPKGNKYWEERDKGEWGNAPKIYDDDCQAFF